MLIYIYRTQEAETRYTIMIAALQTRTSAPVQPKFKRSRFKQLTGAPSEIAYATRIRAVTARKFTEFADQMSLTYTLVNDRFALVCALADMFHEMAATQTDADWWINNRLRKRWAPGHYDMVGSEVLANMFHGYTHLFNEITLAHGVNDITASDVADCAVDDAEPIGTCKSIGGRMCCLTSQGWVGIE